MSEPVIVPRSDHPISRASIDPDALKVLYRLHESSYTAYLVGGSVRDLLLSRRPKDFDIGTSAHPYQVKKLFRNCWIIGRRFRLAHVRFGTKTIEVATFRKLSAGRRRRSRRTASTRRSTDLSAETARDLLDPPRQHLRHARGRRLPARLHRQRAVLRHRRLLDHRLRRRPRGPAGAAHPLDRRSRTSASRKIRCACCARSCWPRGSTSRSIRRSSRPSPRIAHCLAHAAPARMIEEYYKILRSGHARRPSARWPSTACSNR